MSAPDRAVPVIVGPTASGKSRLAMRLAAAIGRCEIISADSRQVYREISIGTAKPGLDDLSLVPHHLVDICSVTRRYSAGQFARDAASAVDEIRSRGSTPIIVGGSGFYVRALFEGLAAPRMLEQTRLELEQFLEESGPDRLHAALALVDEASALATPVSNHERVIRALACYRETGRPYSTFSGGADKPHLKPNYLLLLPDRDRLWARIHKRAGEMIEEGIIDETKSVLDLEGVTDISPGLRTVGYKEVIRYLAAGPGSIEWLHEEIFVATRRYAKRQRTWFRNQIDPTLTLEGGDAVDEALMWLRQIVNE